MRAPDSASTSTPPAALSGSGGGTFCQAPSVSLYFDTQGAVQACCQNTKYPLGHVATDRLRDIWHGPRAAALRDALARDNLAAGCEFCAWQWAAGDRAGVFARNFDRFAAGPSPAAWPRMMEFSLSNACNLQCVMCNGLFSSSIRANLEHLPPLVSPYGERFFAELDEFLPHLEFAKFLGGEPFLSREAARIWQRLVELGLATRCHVTTNGTQYDARVVEWLERLPFDIVVSLDGITAATVEAIRVGARFEVIRANVLRLRDYARERGTYFGLAFCLMRQNWREFGEFLRWCDELDCEAIVNVVRHPPECSLYTLSADELRTVTDELTACSRGVSSRLTRSRSTWEQVLDELRARLEGPDLSRRPFAGPWDLVAIEPSARAETLTATPVTELEARRWLERWDPAAPVTVLMADGRDRLQQVLPAGADVLGLAAERCLGRTLAELAPAWRDAMGPELTWCSQRSADYLDRNCVWPRAPGGPRYARLISLPVRSEYGLPSASVTVVASSGPLANAVHAAEFQPPDWLRHWSLAAEPVAIELDDARALTYQSPEFAELLADGPTSTKGMSWDLWLGTWGRLTEAHDVASRPGVDARWAEYERGRGRRALAWELRHTPAAGAGAGGWRGWLALAALTPQNQSARERAAREILTGWAPGGALLRHEVDLHGRFVAADIPGQAFPELAGDWLGQPLTELDRVFRAHHTKLTVLHHERVGWFEDLVVSGTTAGQGWQLRSLRSPQYDDRGRFVAHIVWAVRRAADMGG